MRLCLYLPGGVFLISVYEYDGGELGRAILGCISMSIYLMDGICRPSKNSR